MQMSLVDRAKNILISPKTEWDVIARENATIGGLFTGYAIPMSVLPVIGSVVAMGLLGIGVGAFATLGMGSIGVGMALGMAAVGLVISLILLYAMSFIVNAVSPNFNGKSDLASATKLMTYASTPSWIGGLIAPFLGPVGGVVSIAAIAYVVYLIYTGIRPVMEVPADKVAGFTVVIILIYIVLSLLLSMVIGGMLIATFFGGAMMAGAAGM
jgi:Yip1 domain